VQTVDDILNIIKIFPGISYTEIYNTTPCCNGKGILDKSLKILEDQKEIFNIRTSSMIMENGKALSSFYFDKSCLEFFER